MSIMGWLTSWEFVGENVVRRFEPMTLQLGPIDKEDQSETSKAS